VHGVIYYVIASPNMANEFLASMDFIKRQSGFWRIVGSHVNMYGQTNENRLSVFNHLLLGVDNMVKIIR
jgi:hypothetical protein